MTYAAAKPLVDAKPKAIALDGGHSIMATVRANEMAEIQAWQITTPEGLIAFFSERMLETNRDLRNLIQGQTKRNDTVAGLNEMQRILAKVKDKQELKPGTADWNEFERLLKEVRNGLPQGEVADQVEAMLGEAMKGVPYEADWVEYKDAEAAAKSFVGPARIDLQPWTGKWKVTADQGPPQGVGAETAKDLATKLKNVADNMQGANQMDSIRVQELVSRVSQIMSTVSNIIAKFDEGKKTAINNMR